MFSEYRRSTNSAFFFFVRRLAINIEQRIFFALGGQLTFSTTLIGCAAATCRYRLMQKNFGLNELSLPSIPYSPKNFLLL
jgi:hypothetical protein